MPVSLGDLIQRISTLDDRSEFSSLDQLFQK
jgi:hypothetical protein